MKKDLPIYVVISGIIIWMIYVIVTGFDNRDKLYLITTDESFYTSKDILLDSKNCLIFVDDMTDRKVRVCGNYEIKNPKNYEIED